MQPVTPDLRPDPAPSRLSYRFQRLWLTPVFWVVLRIGLPIAVILGTAGFYLGDAERREALIDWAYDIRHDIQNRPEFLVNLMAIDGAGPEVAEDIRDVVPLDFPLSSFDLDLDQIRETVSGLDAVKSARVRIRSGGVLQVDVTLRTPVVVWRSRDGLETLDATGARVGALDSRLTRADLPLITGDGADAAVAEALALIRAADPLNGRLRGLVRVGERRWDVVLDRGQRILLPEADALPALERVIAYAQANDLLARDLVLVDMRLSDRPTLRMTSRAVEELWRIRTMENEERQE